MLFSFCFVRVALGQLYSEAHPHPFFFCLRTYHCKGQVGGQKKSNCGLLQVIFLFCCWNNSDFHCSL